MIYIAAVLIPTTAKLQLSPCTLQCEIRTVTIHPHVLVSDTPIVALIGHISKRCRYGIRYLPGESRNVLHQFLARFELFAFIIRRK